MFDLVVTSPCNYLIKGVKTIGLPAENFSAALSRIGVAYLTVLVAAPCKDFYDAGPLSVKDVIAQTIDRAMTQHEITPDKHAPHLLANDFIAVLRGQSQIHCLLHRNSFLAQDAITDLVNQAVNIILHQVGVGRSTQH